MLEIKDIGLVFESPEGIPFRKVIFKDTGSKVETDYNIYEKTNPYLWKTIDKIESGNNAVKTIPGRIELYNGIDIVILNGEEPSEAFEKQKWKFKEHKKLTRKEAESKIKTSQGYITELNPNNSITPGWIPLVKNAEKIKFRYYHKPVKEHAKNHPYFEWSEWFEIVNKF